MKGGVITGILAIGACAGLCPVQVQANPVRFDAGIGRVWVTGGNIYDGPTIEKESPSWATHLGASMEVSPVFSARVGVTSMTTMKALKAFAGPLIPEATGTPWGLGYESKIYVLTLSPRFRVVSSTRF